jgi:tetratricopeptide (TPR) repeat protein
MYQAATWDHDRKERLQVASLRMASAHGRGWGANRFGILKNQVLKNALLTCLLCALLAQIASAAAPSARRKLRKKPAPKTLPVTTTSKDLERQFQGATENFIYFHLDAALAQWRALTRSDPEFALAYAFLSFATKDPAEEKTVAGKARALQSKVTPGERLVIQWMTDVRGGDYLAGIAAMNDVVAMYPRDKQLVYLAGNWLLLQQSLPRAEKLLMQALAIDKDYPPPWNALGYLYAEQRDFDKAVSHMERYVALRPEEPNPHDSYAEVLRMAGKLSEAMTQYQEALKINPRFSLLGVADTYALMGNQEQARATYQRGIRESETIEDRLQCRLQYPITYVRERNYAEADRTFLELASWARTSKQPLIEVQAQRMMAEYQPDNVTALKYLADAETLLLKAPISAADRDEERARILRWRVLRALADQQQGVAGAALTQLEALSNANPSDVIQHAWHAAAGAFLVAAQRYEDAIAHLEEDTGDPLSLQLLAQCHAALGNTQKAQETRKQLSTLYIPTLEQALVAPEMRR